MPHYFTNKLLQKQAHTVQSWLQGQYAHCTPFHQSYPMAADLQVIMMTFDNSEYAYVHHTWKMSLHCLVKHRTYFADTSHIVSLPHLGVTESRQLLCYILRNEC